jgi:hypothetical protein
MNFRKMEGQQPEDILFLKFNIDIFLINLSMNKILLKIYTLKLIENSLKKYNFISKKFFDFRLFL